MEWGVAAMLAVTGVWGLRSLRRKRGRTIAGMLRGRPPCAERREPRPA